MAISAYSTTPASNTTISGINIAEGCAPSGINDALRQMMADLASYIVSSGIQIVAAGGTADAITATYAPAIPALADQIVCAIVASAANATTTPTFAPNGLTARTITKKGGNALSPGDIPGAGAVCLLEYNLANTRWELINPAGAKDAWVAAGGTADAITATYVPAVPALTDGLRLSFRATAANATTTPTFAPNGLTAYTITKSGGSALVAGDIPGNLAEMMVVYNLANTRWELLNPKAAATTTAINRSSGDNSTNIANTAYADARTSQHAFLTSGTTWTSPANINSGTVFKLTVIGGGGGCSGGSTLAGAGAGGQSYKWVSGAAASTGYTYAIGAAGSAGGGNGGNTTITINATTVTANGGVGTTTSSGGAGGTATGGDINITGQGGQQSNGSGTPDYAMGGSTPYGGGGSQNSVATGYGSGAGVGGGAGGQGMILIEWVA